MSDVETKICTTCGTDKPLSEYYMRSKANPTLHAECKECIRNRSRVHYAENGTDPERVRAWRDKNRDRINAKGKEWRVANPDKARASIYRWNEKNPEKYRETQLRNSRRRQSLPKERLQNSISRAIRNGIKIGSKMGRPSFALLGYTRDELVAHLEKLFEPGMTWDNYGKFGWHIDHKIPLSVHNYQTPDDIDFKRAWALSNLQPMWATPNRVKHAKLFAPFQPSLALALPANDNQPKEAAA